MSNAVPAPDVLRDPPARAGTVLTPSSTDSERSRASRLRWLLALILTGQFMAILDATIVNVATPTIRVDLHASGGELQLIVAGYTIAYAVLLITGARLGARVGYRRMFLVGLATFTAASFACGVSPTSTVVIFFRCVQGAGAAAMVPQVFSLIQRNFEGAARARALSLYAAVIALGAVIGQILGGILVTANLLGTGWRPVFLVNVPIGLVLLVLTARILPADRREPSRSFDVAGLVALAIAVLLLVVPLVLGHEEGWPAWTFVSLAGSVVALGVFAAIERAVGRRGGSPLISGRVLGAPGMVAGSVALFFGMAGYGGFLFSIAQHLQTGLGESAAQAGLTFAPAALGFALSSLNWRRVPAAWHRTMIPVGFAVAAVGYASTALVLADGSRGGLALPIVLFGTGLGMGFAFSPVLAVALTFVAPGDAPDASGVLTTIIQLGQVVGVSTFGSVFLSLAAQPGLHATASALASTLELVAVGMAAGASAAIVLARPPRVSARRREAVPVTVEVEDVEPAG